METSTKSSAINYGLYLGGSLALFTILCYALKIELLVNFWLIFLVLPILIITVGIISSLKSKSMLNGFISFRETFSSYFITIAIAIIINAIISYVIFNFVDPDAAIQLKQLAIEKTESMMTSFGAPLEEVAKQIEAIENQDTTSLKAQLLSVAQSLIFFAVIGLISSLIIKRNPETEE